MRQKNQDLMEEYVLNSAELDEIRYLKVQFLNHPGAEDYLKEVRKTIAELNRIYRLRDGFKLRLVEAEKYDDLEDHGLYYILWTPDDWKTQRHQRIVKLQNKKGEWNGDADIEDGTRWMMQVNARYAALAMGRQLEMKRHKILNKEDHLENAPLWSIAATPVMAGGLLHMRENLRKHRLCLEGGMLSGSYDLFDINETMKVTTYCDIRMRNEKLRISIRNMPASILMNIKEKGIGEILSFSGIDMTAVSILNVESWQVQDMTNVEMTLDSPMARVTPAPMGAHHDNPIIAWLTEAKVDQDVIDEAVDRICNHGRGWNLTGERIHER